jgi:hypothetical protein
MVIPARRSSFVIAVATAGLLASAARAYSSDPAAAVGFVVVDPLTSSTVYAATSAGLYRTVDAGEHWAWISPTLPDLHALVIDPLAPVTLYAASSSHGVFRSTDAGSTWIPIGVSYWWVNALAVDPYTGTLYAAVDNGVFTWEPTGGNWSQIFAPLAYVPAEFAWVYSVAVRSPASYIGVFYGDYETGTAAVFTGQYSGTVLSTYPPTDAIPVDVLAIDPTNPSIAYAGVRNDSLFKTTDGGATWFRSTMSGVYQLVIDPSHPNTVYAADYRGVAKSTDGGTTSTAAGEGLIDTLLAYGLSPTVTLAIDPQTPDTLYAGTAMGMFKTIDGGGHWTPAGLNQQSPLGSLSVAPLYIVSGDSATGTVTLAVAQATDVAIPLSTSDETRVTVPPSVTVLAGATSATFAISTNQVFTTGTISIRASLGDATRTAALWVYAQTNVRDVYVDGSVVGGNSALGRVFLTRSPGSIEAIEVKLGSSNTAVAAVAPIVMVPADAEFADFTIATTAVATATTVAISATYPYGRTASRTITVNQPPAPLTVSLTADRTAPQVAGTSIIFTATGAGGQGAYQYKFWVYDGAPWQIVRDWSATGTYTWQPATANSDYIVAVWIRNAATTTDTKEADAGISFAIQPAPPAKPVQVSLTANRKAPQVAGTQIKFTAAASGGQSPYQYKWWIYDGATWRLLKDWSTSNTYTWRPTSANANYIVGVWVRNTSTTTDTKDGEMTMVFPIK